MDGWRPISKQVYHIRREELPIRLPWRRRSSGRSDDIPYRAGDRFGSRFRVERVMRGSMGVVLVLRNEKPEGPFDPEVRCAKTFHARYFDHQAARRDFLAEAETWIRLGRYEHVAWALDYEEIGGRPYVYMQYLDGGSLADKFGQGFSPRRNARDRGLALVFAFGLALGMRQIYTVLRQPHGDLSPRNILFGQGGGLVKVSDFGLAAAVRQTGERAVVRDIRQFGTLLWYLYTGREEDESTIAVALAAEEWMIDAVRDLIAACLSSAETDGARFFDDAVSRLDAGFYEVTGQHMMTPVDYHASQRAEIAKMMLGALRDHNPIVTAVTTAPEPVSAYINRGAAMLDLDRLDDAVDNFVIALGLLVNQQESAESRIVWANLQRLFARVPDVRKRHEYFQRAVRAWSHPDPGLWQRFIANADGVLPQS